MNKKYIKDYFLTKVDNHILNVIKNPLKHKRSEVLSIIHKNKSKIFNNLYLTTLIINDKYLLEVIFQDKKIRNHLLEETNILKFLIMDNSNISNKALNHINENKKPFLSLLKDRNFVKTIIKSNNLLNIKDFKSFLDVITDIHGFNYIESLLKENGNDYIISHYENYPKKRHFK